MDTWKYFDITHKEHILCNPTSIDKFERLISLLRLPPNSQVLEIAAGKGEFIIQLAQRYDISGVGIDLSPYCIADAKVKLNQRAPNAEVTFLEMDGADYKPDNPSSFDLTACIGAGWIFNRLEGTIKALKSMTKPGGLIVIGEPYWLRKPDPDYLASSGMKENSYGTHYDNVQIGQRSGLNLLFTIVSNHDDWDKYEGLQWYAADKYALGNTDDPDIAELMEKVNQSKQTYLRWGRDTLGWSIYVFRNN